MIDGIAQAMQGKQVNFLYARGALRRHADMDVARAKFCGHAAAVAAGQRYHIHAVFVRGGHCRKHVFRVAAGCGAKSRVPPAAQTQRARAERDTQTSWPLQQEHLGRESRPERH